VKFIFRSLGVYVPDEVITTAERKFTKTLRHSAKSVEQILLTVIDTNGPKGGVDKLCRVTVFLAHSGRLTLEERDVNVSAGLARLAERTSLSISRAIERRHSRESIRHQTDAQV
jgi:putative sigma-54 modulation protein